jgi:hypothetical protein
VLFLFGWHMPALYCCKSLVYRLQGPCHMFQVSPQLDRAGAVQLAPQDPPKIRVVVRKRPINRKVRASEIRCVGRHK